MQIAAWTAPVALSAIPAGFFLVLMFLFGTTPPAAAMFFFVGLIATIVGFLTGLGIAGFLTYRRSTWTAEMREKIAADGIRAEEVDWFYNELTSHEKRQLKAINARDELYGDAYRETLASRLTASRIIKSSARELSLSKRRKDKVKRLNSENSERFVGEIERDITKIDTINKDAKQMLAEAESRLQMIEAAVSRGGTFADTEMAMKRLSARAEQLPLALEGAKMTEDIRREIEKELNSEK